MPGSSIKSTKGTSLADLTRFPDPFKGFISTLEDGKREGRLRFGHREVILTHCREFPNKPNSTKIGTWVAVAGLISMYQSNQIKSNRTNELSLVIISRGTMKLRRVKICMSPLKWLVAYRPVALPCYYDDLPKVSAVLTAWA